MRRTEHQPDKPIPNHLAPDLEVETADSLPFNLDHQKPAEFTLVVFYRGLHCPVCKEYLSELSRLHMAFAERGVSMVAVSMDDRQRAEQAVRDWELRGFPVGYGLSEASARQWGLYISEAIKEAEPRRFSEPGLFLIRNDKTVHLAVINSMPFARPQLRDVLDAIDFIIREQYPPRGNLAA